MSRKFIYLVIGIGILFLCACPAQAFTAKNLDIVVQDNGDARITFNYALNWYEYVAVFARIADPGTELKKALEGNYGKNVDVIATTGNQVEILVHDYASRTVKDNRTTLNTPVLSFRSAEKVLETYWFAPLIDVDFSPELTRVVFPDGFMQQYNNQIEIPALSHTLN